MPSNAKLATGSRLGGVEHHTENHAATVVANSSGTVGELKTDEPSIAANPFINDLVDCIENLPNRLQLILTEIRDIDVQVSGWLLHNKHPINDFMKILMFF